MNTKVVITWVQNNVAITALAVVAIILVALIYMFFTAGKTAADDLHKVEQERLLANTQLMQVRQQYNVDELQKQLDELNSGIATAKAVNKFPESINRDQLELDLANEASRRGVTLVSLSSITQSGTETIGGNTYNKSEINIKVEGLLNNTSLFLTSMEQGDFPTLKFKNVSLAKASEGEKWTTTFTLVVLSQS